MGTAARGRARVRGHYGWAALGTGGYRAGYRIPIAPGVDSENRRGRHDRRPSPFDLPVPPVSPRRLQPGVWLHTTHHSREGTPVVQTVPPTSSHLLDPHLRLRESEERLRLALWAARMATWEWDIATGHVSLTGTLGTITGLRPGLGNLPAADLYPSQIAAVHPEDRARVAAAAKRTTETGADYSVEFRVVGQDGAVRWLADQGRVLERDAAGRARRVAGVVMEVTERRVLQDQLAHQATHDSLTGLPNRALFLRTLAEALAPPDHDTGVPPKHDAPAPVVVTAAAGPRTLTPVAATAPHAVAPAAGAKAVRHDAVAGDGIAAGADAPASQAVAVLYLDLDGFKGVNDRLGHEAGDQLLQAVAERLRGVLRTGDTIARLGGDEFAAILPPPIDLDDAAAVAARVIRVLGGGYTLEAGPARISASVGVAAGIPGRAAAEAVLREADAALRGAKRAGKATYAVFAPGHAAPLAAAPPSTRAHGSLAADLRGAVARDELRLAYQPEIDLRTGRIAGLEALVRWARPGAGGKRLDPADFLGLAEETGLIVEIGDWVLAEACRCLATWHRLLPGGAGPGGGPLPFVAVNLSARQVRDPGLAATVAAVLAETGLPPACLQLELGGEAARAEPRADGAAAFALGELRRAGVRLAIDGFGAGAAGLGMLRELPVDVVKLDRSFAARCGEERRDAAVVRSVVALAADLGLTVVATGIETPAQLATMRALGCTHALGHALSPPLTPEEAMALFR